MRFFGKKRPHARPPAAAEPTDWFGLDPSVSGHMYNVLQQYLRPRGWLRSVEQSQSVDLHGPVPWYTYPMLAVLPQLVQSRMRAFEYGSGNSSRWWQRHVTEVVSVEHDPKWHAIVTEADDVPVKLIEANSSCNEAHHAALDEFFALKLDLYTTGDAATDTQRGVAIEPFRSYAAELLNYPQGHFDVIIVDGMARVLTAWLAAKQVNPGGMVIFDNTDRAEFEPGCRILQDAGFAQIDYWGIGPLNPYGWCTSLFVRDLAVLRRDRGRAGG